MARRSSEAARGVKHPLLYKNTPLTQKEASPMASYKTKDNKESHGVGLSIVFLDSETGKEATFYIEIPKEKRVFNKYKKLSLLKSS